MFSLGIPWDKEERKEAINSRKAFFLQNEKPNEDKNGIKRESLPQPWMESTYHIIKYIPCEGRMSVVYSYHLRLFHYLIYLPNQ
jgi:hypothetical protein